MAITFKLPRNKAFAGCKACGLPSWLSSPSFCLPSLTNNMQPFLILAPIFTYSCVLLTWCPFCHWMYFRVSMYVLISEFIICFLNFFIKKIVFRSTFLISSHFLRLKYGKMISYHSLSHSHSPNKELQRRVIKLGWYKLTWLWLLCL